jgi:FkbM family methyltransferase
MTPGHLTPRERALLAARWLVDVAPPRVGLALVDALEGRRGETEIAFLPALVRRGEMAVDAGANRGVYARRLARLCPRVLACEPQPALARRLARAVPRNVVVLPVALSDTPGETTLRIPLLASTAVHTRGTLGDGGSENLEVTALRLRLDDLALESVGFAKIDVEGHELPLLAGAVQTLRRCRPRLLVECDVTMGAHPADVAERLQPLSYEGWFCFGGDLLPVTDFDATTHQHEPKAIAGPRPASLVTNFMFLPGDEATEVLEAIRLLQPRR